MTGNIETGSMSRGVISRNVALRNELDLFINVLHCKSYPGVKARHKDIDIVIIRQNTEGEYAMLEHEVSNTGKNYLRHYLTKKITELQILGN